MSCRAIREWLHVDAAALDEAQRLRFDDHLASCAECRGDRERMRVVRDVGRSLPVPAAGSRDYSRAIARALLEGASAPAPRRRPVWLVPLAIGALVATAAAAVVIARRDEESPRPPQVVIPAPAPAQVQQEAAVVQEQPPAPKKQVVKKQVARKPRVDVIAEARVQLAAGHYEEAEKSVLVLLEKSQSRAEQAEAWMFLADLAQASGNLGTAVTRYQTVATKFVDLPAAESALYAAARIEARRGRSDAARALYDQYLERYANGRYAEDVRDKRRQLR
jgi:hypothetical protein